MTLDDNDRRNAEGEGSNSNRTTSIPRRFLERTVDDIIKGREPYDSEWKLRALHHVRGYTQQEIADAYGVSQVAISRAMRRRGVETRETEGEGTISDEDGDENPNGATAD